MEPLGKTKKMIKKCPHCKHEGKVEIAINKFNIELPYGPVFRCLKCYRVFKDEKNARKD